MLEQFQVEKKLIEGYNYLSPKKNRINDVKVKRKVDIQNSLKNYLKKLKF